MGSIDGLLKIFLIFLAAFTIFAMNEVIYRYFYADKKLLDTISKWIFWGRYFFYCVFTLLKNNHIYLIFLYDSFLFLLNIPFI
jgi:hypothetical protein